MRAMAALEDVSAISWALYGERRRIGDRAATGDDLVEFTATTNQITSRGRDA